MMAEVTPRDDVYTVASLLAELDRVLHPLQRGSRGQVRIAPSFPPALPGAGGPGPNSGSMSGGGFLPSHGKLGGVSSNSATREAARHLGGRLAPEASDSVIFKRDERPSVGGAGYGQAGVNHVRPAHGPGLRTAQKVNNWNTGRIQASKSAPAPKEPTSTRIPVSTRVKRESPVRDSGRVPTGRNGGAAASKTDVGRRADELDSLAPTRLAPPLLSHSQSPVASHRVQPPTTARPELSRWSEREAALAFDVANHASLGGSSEPLPRPALEPPLAQSTPSNAVTSERGRHAEGEPGLGTPRRAFERGNELFLGAMDAADFARHTADPVAVSRRDSEQGQTQHSETELGETEPSEPELDELSLTEPSGANNVFHDAPRGLRYEPGRRGKALQLSHREAERLRRRLQTTFLEQALMRHR